MNGSHRLVPPRKCWREVVLGRLVSPTSRLLNWIAKGALDLYLGAWRDAVELFHSSIVQEVQVWSSGESTASRILCHSVRKLFPPGLVPSGGLGRQGPEQAIAAESGE